MHATWNARGSTILEAVIAIAILASAVVWLAGLASVSMRAVATARDRTNAATFAAAKLEQLKASAAALPVSNPDAAASDQPGFFEYLDGGGAVVGVSAAVAGVVYVRRWSVLNWSAAPGLRMLNVVVARCRRATAASGASCGDVESAVGLATVEAVPPW